MIISNPVKITFTKKASLSSKYLLRTKSVFTYISDDFDQAVCCAASVADTLHSRKQVRRGITQQHAHFVGLTSAAAQRKRERQKFRLSSLLSKFKEENWRCCNCLFT